MNPYAITSQRLSKRVVATATVGLMVALLGAVPFAAASCPAAAEIQSRLGELGLERAARTARFSEPPPLELYRKASRKVGTLEVDRDDGKGIGVVVVDLPVQVLWRAINDEGAQDEGGYMPLKRSEIIGGTPRGVSRRVFQAGERMGLGRWWVTRTVMSGELFEASDGALWEVVWEGDMVGLAEPPVTTRRIFRRSSERGAPGCWCPWPTTARWSSTSTGQSPAASWA